MPSLHAGAAGVSVRWFVSLALIGGPAVACAQQPALPAASNSARGDDALLIGCYGGDQGGGSGNKLTRSGDQWTFEKPLQADATYTLLRRDSTAAAQVFAALERVQFRDLRFNVVVNMTCVLELEDGSGEHTVSWPRGQPPEAIQPVLVALARAFGDDRGMWP